VIALLLGLILVVLSIIGGVLLAVLHELEDHTRWHDRDGAP
jgi:hypothetical protein